MKLEKYKFLVALLMGFYSFQTLAQVNPTVQLSVDLLEAIKKEDGTEVLVKHIGELSQSKLIHDLDTDEKRLAFWINIYNGFIQDILRKEPKAYKDRNQFFKKAQIQIAGRKMSFADIEHGIIRRSQFELFLGYLTNPFAPEWQKKLRVDNKDYRIHFALNCGARSCPPVYIYDDVDFDRQINEVTSKFLKESTTYDAEKDHAMVVALFSWFRGDFGGGQGIREILKKYGATPKKPEKVTITEYDWTLDLNNWW